MKEAQKQLLHLINAVRRGEKAAWEEEVPLWQEIIEQADAHHIKGLIYPGIDNESIQKVEPQLLKNWKKDVFITGVSQSQHIAQVVEVLEAFQKMNVPVIVLKGLVVRQFYPRPELRTMSDADFLVPLRDLEKIESYLLSLGYVKEEASPVHIAYVHPKRTTIEVHWTIRDARIFEQVNSLEEELWNEAVPVKIRHIEVLSLGLEDLIIHLCAHMATHLLVGGFGVRQVLDLALLLEQKEDEVNWENFKRKAQVWKLEVFIVAVIGICHELFELPMPEGVKSLGENNEKIINELIEEIFDGGVYGRSDMTYVFAHELAANRGEGDDKRGTIHNFLDFLCPAKENLSDTYHYAKKYPILLPIAWIHHFYRGMTHHDYSIKEKIKFSCKAYIISKKRSQLLKQLELN
ncbi:MAG: nucleotidyltransferase family protein [Niameybacter sp.]